MAALMDLKLSWRHRIKYVGYDYLAFLTAITTIDLFSCDGITDMCLTCLAIVTSLQDLNLGYYFKIDIVGADYVVSITALNKLSLSHCYK